MASSAAAIATYDELVERCADSTESEPQLRDAVAGALRNTGELRCMMGEGEGALRKADELRALAGRADSALILVHSAWIEAMASALLRRLEGVEALFREICAAFDPDQETMLQAFHRSVPALVALGAKPEVLADVLEENPETNEVLRPLAVALRLEAGEKVRAPKEMLEVAEDIRAGIDEKRRQRMLRQSPVETS